MGSLKASMEEKKTFLVSLSQSKPSKLFMVELVERLSGGRVGPAVTKDKKKISKKMNGIVLFILLMGSF